MITRSKAKAEKIRLDEEKSSYISKLPKEVIFTLLLQLELDELRVVCFSKNPKIREICTSEIFQKAYIEKFPKKLIHDPVTIAINPTNPYYFEIMQNKPLVILEVFAKPNKINTMTYRPYDKNFMIVFYERDGRNYIRIEPKFNYVPENYNQEVKEFLHSIERGEWWSPDIQDEKSLLTEKATMEFYNQAIDIMKDKVNEKYNLIFR